MWRRCSASRWCCAARSTASRWRSTSSSFPGDPERLAWLDALLSRGAGLRDHLHAHRGRRAGHRGLPGRPRACRRRLHRSHRGCRAPAHRGRAGRQRAEGGRRHERARHGIRQARPHVRRPSRQPVQPHRLLPAGGPRRPGHRARRGLPAADPGGFGDLVLLRLGVDARRADGPPAARASSTIRCARRRRSSRWSTCAAPGSRWC